MRDDAALGDAAIYTIKGLTETAVVFRFSTGEGHERRFWEDAARDFAGGDARQFSEENCLDLGFAFGDDEQIQEAVRQASGNFPGGNLES